MGKGPRVIRCKFPGVLSQWSHTGTHLILPAVCVTIHAKYHKPWKLTSALISRIFIGGQWCRLQPSATGHNSDSITLPSLNFCQSKTGIFHKTSMVQGLRHTEIPVKWKYSKGSGHLPTTGQGRSWRLELEHRNSTVGPITSPLCSLSLNFMIFQMESMT